MRAVLQRTTASYVTVNDEVMGSIGKGIAVLLGIKKGDTRQDAQYMADKIVNLRIFPDQEGKMNCSLLESQGEILLISQFTLYGDARKGRRPGFSDASSSGEAQPLFNDVVEFLRSYGIKVETGVFGADMIVHIENDGPCTILLDSERVF